MSQHRAANICARTLFAGDLHAPPFLDGWIVG
jgi:hypothetical protein